MKRLSFALVAWLFATAGVYAVEQSLAERAKEIRAELAEHLVVRNPDREELQQHRDRLQEAANQLALFLETADPEVVSGWKDYLSWTELQEQLVRQRPNTTTLRDILLSYRRDRTGLDMAAFQDVRAALIEYIHALDLADAMADENHLDTCLGRLSRSLAAYERNPNYPDAYVVGRELYRLEQSTTSSSDAIESIRNRFRYPNAYGRASLRMVNRMMARKVNDETEINEVSDGKYTRGTAITDCELQVEYVGAGERAAIDIRLSGTTRAPRTITQQRSITVYGSFLTNVDARKRIYMDKKGLSYAPAQVNCSTSIQINDIVADRRIVERIARRRAPRLTPEAEADVSRSTERRFQQKLDQQLEAALTEANGIFVNHFCVPNQRYGAFPAMMRFSTTPENLELRVRAADPWHLAAPEPPPELDPKHDLGFALHESLFGNYAESVFGGKTLTDKQWLKMMNVLTGSEPRALWVHDRTDRWSLTFADRRPIVVRFRDGTFTVTVRSKKIVRAKQSLVRPVDITGTFHIEVTADGPVMFREGKAPVGFVDGGSADVEEQDILDFVDWKFSAIMPRALYADGLVPPAGGSLSMLRKLKPKEYSFNGGWMKIGYQLVDGETDASPMAAE